MYVYPHLHVLDGVDQCTSLGQPCDKSTLEQFTKIYIDT